MMKKRVTLFCIILLLFIVLLAACGGTAVSPTPTPTVTTSSSESTDVETNNSVRTFVVVPEESQASYIVNEEFLADALNKLGIEAGKKIVVGTTPGVTGEIQLNLENPGQIEHMQINADMAGLQTDQERRDKWLLDNAIESSSFPQATFTATSVNGMPENITEGEDISFQLIGDLTVRDVTNNVTFDVTAVLTGDTLQGTATLPLKMTDFGIDPPDFAKTLKVADDFSIEVVLTAREN